MNILHEIQRLLVECAPLLIDLHGEVAEWSNVPDSKSGVAFTLPWVRIPPSPPKNSVPVGVFLFLALQITICNQFNKNIFSSIACDILGKDIDYRTWLLTTPK